MSESDETNMYEAPRFEVIGSLHELTQAVVGPGDVTAKTGAPLTDIFSGVNSVAQIS